MNAITILLATLAIGLAATGTIYTTTAEPEPVTETPTPCFATEPRNFRDVGYQLKWDPPTRTCGLDSDNLRGDYTVAYKMNANTGTEIIQPGGTVLIWPPQWTTWDHGKQDRYNTLRLDLAYNTWYNFRVELGQFGDFAWLDVLSRPNPNAHATNFRITNMTTTSINLAWDAPAPHGEETVKYAVYCNTSNPNRPPHSGHSIWNAETACNHEGDWYITGTNATYTGLEPATQYWFMIKTVYGDKAIYPPSPIITGIIP